MKIIRTILKNRERVLFILVLLFGSVLRLYRLPETMQFLGDQGRDALIARGILIDHDPAFIGPVTSVGNMYLGPFYYYFMVLPLMVSYPSPVGPAVAVAFVGIVTLGLLYVLGKDMVGRRAAMIAMMLYAVSPVVINGVRFSWNPNIVPFFSLLLVWSVWKTTRRQFQYWILSGLAIAALFQLHYIALILIGAVGLVWIYELKDQLQHNKLSPIFLRSSVAAVLIFVLSLAPLFLFDLKHEWLNTKAFLEFFHPTHANESHFRKLSDVSGIMISFLSMLSRIVVEFFGITAKNIGQKVMVSFLFTYLVLRALMQRGEKRKVTVQFLFYLFGISVLFLSMYSSSVFDHYLGFVLPIAFLLFGVVLGSVSRSVFLMPLAAGVMVIFILYSMKNYPGFAKIGGTVFSFDQSSTEIVKHIPEGETFALLSYAPSHDLQAMNYRYFITTKGKIPTAPDDWLTSRYLIIIDEEHRDNPFDESQYVIKIWPNRTIVDSFSIPNGPDVYVMKRY